MKWIHNSQPVHVQCLTQYRSNNNNSHTLHNCNSYKMYLRMSGTPFYLVGYSMVTGITTHFLHCDYTSKHCIIDYVRSSDCMRIFRLNYAADLKDLIADLREVIEWRTFGMHLNVPLVDMEHIQSDNRSDLRACREQMLITWAKVATPTWQAVVHSLIKTGYKRLAKDIAQKRGMYTWSCSNNACTIDFSTSVKRPPRY